jgi:hypothetical protein
MQPCSPCGEHGGIIVIRITLRAGVLDRCQKWPPNDQHPTEMGMAKGKQEIPRRGHAPPKGGSMRLAGEAKSARSPGAGDAGLVQCQKDGRASREAGVAQSAGRLAL